MESRNFIKYLRECRWDANFEKCGNFFQSKHIPNNHPPWYLTKCFKDLPLNKNLHMNIYSIIIEYHT